MTSRRPAELVSAVAEDLPEHEAYRLLSVATGRSRADLMRGEDLDRMAVGIFASLVSRRRAGEPLQYIEGTVEFGRLELAIDERALVPRPETERMWELAVTLVDSPGVVVDLCTGSGNLALALKQTFPGAAVYGSDSSDLALALARENGERTGLAVTWCRGDLFDALPDLLQGEVDLLVSNPPYVAESEHAQLPGDVRDHEPVGALVAGPRGTEAIERIGAQVARWVKPGGVVVCEIGETQRDAALAAFAGFDVDVLTDLADRDRFLVARAPLW